MQNTVWSEICTYTYYKSLNTVILHSPYIFPSFYLHVCRMGNQERVSKSYILAFIFHLPYRGREFLIGMEVSVGDFENSNVFNVENCDSLQVN